MISLANNFNANSKGYSAWSLSIDSIKILYVKKGKVPSKVPVKKDTAEVKKLKATIAKLQKKKKTTSKKKKSGKK